MTPLTARRLVASHNPANRASAGIQRPDQLTERVLRVLRDCLQSLGTWAGNGEERADAVMALEALAAGLDEGQSIIEAMIERLRAMGERTGDPYIETRQKDRDIEGAA